MQLAGTVLAIVLVYYIGKQTAENAVFFMFAGAALLLGIPLGCMTWPPQEDGRHFTLVRAAFAALSSVAVVVITAVIGYFYPDHTFVAPALTGAGLLMVIFVQAP